MTDYAAAAVQPIVQGLITVPTGLPGGALVFTGRGALLVPNLTGALGRPNAPLSATGLIVLTLDVGLPGNAGAIEPLPNNAVPPVGGPAAPLPRALVQVRAPLTGVPTTLTSVSVTYGNFTVPAPVDGGLRQVMIQLALAAGTLVDPIPTGGPPATGGANGVEVVIWAGVESP